MKRSKFYSRCLSALCLLAGALPARADVSDLLFKVEISGPRDKPTLLVTNMSPNVDITRFEMTIGDTNVDWNGYVMDKINPPGGTATIAIPASNTKVDLLRVDLTNFGPGESFSITIELDSDPNGVESPTLDPSTQHWNTVFYNNGAGTPNSVATVYSGPKIAVLQFPENPSSTTFRGPTRRLSVISRADSDPVERLKVVKVKRDGEYLEVAPGDQIIGEAEFLVAHGDEIEVTAPQVV